MTPNLAILAALLFSFAPPVPANTGSSEPRWSHDGRRIVYVNGHFPEGREIMIMNADGSGVRQLTSNQAADEYPALSPDGRAILFSSNRTGAWRLYLMDVDGSHQRDLGLPSTAVDLNDPCRADWLPDGRQIVFPITNENHEHHLHIANRDGSELRAIPNGRGLYPHSSPDGKSLVFYAGNNLHTINVDGTQRTQITRNDPSSETRPNYPQWSADGASIFFLRGEQVFSIDIDGQREKQYTSPPGMKWYLTVSSRGWIAYTSITEGLDRIYVMDPKGRPRVVAS
jgi:Tol biopolymer transport system component